MQAVNPRYLDFPAAIEDPQVGLRQLEKTAALVRGGERSHRGLNLFHGPDLDLFRAVFRGEFTISGFDGAPPSPPPPPTRRCPVLAAP